MLPQLSAFRLFTAILIALLIGAAFRDVPVLPPSFPKPVRSLFSSREDLWFRVRIVPHPSLRILRVELWALAEVPADARRPLQFGPDLPVLMPHEYAPRDCVRASDEPLDHMADPSVTPRTIYPILWKPVSSGKYEIKASVLDGRGKKVSATRRIEVW